MCVCMPVYIKNVLVYSRRYSPWVSKMATTLHNSLRIKEACLSRVLVGETNPVEHSVEAKGTKNDEESECFENIPPWPVTLHWWYNQALCAQMDIPDWF